MIRKADFMRMLLLITAMAIFADGALYDVETILDASFGGPAKLSAQARTAAISEIVRNMKPGDALHLSARYAVEKVDLSSIPSSTEISGEGAKVIILHGIHEAMDISVPAFLDAGESSGGQTGTFGLSKSLVTSVTGMKGSFKDVKFLNVSGEKKFQFDRVSPGNTYWTTINGFDNCVVLYLNVHSSTGATKPLVQMQNVNNSRICHIVMANYGSIPNPAEFIISGSKDVALLIGDSEGSCSATYMFANVANLVFAGNRVFDSHNRFGSKLSVNGNIIIQGGSGNKLVQSQDIGDPKTSSLHIANSAGAQIWGGFWEDGATIPGDALQVFNTPDGFGGAAGGKWGEPVCTDKEVALRHGDKDFTLASVAANNQLPIPPSIPAVGMGGAMPKMRFTQSPSFGAAVLAAGADPTGRRPSDAAFAKVLAEQGYLDIPSGKFLLSKTLYVAGSQPALARTGRASVTVVGRGPGLTKLVAANSSMSVLKAGTGVSVQNLALAGGKFGLDLTNAYHATETHKNLTITGADIAGIKIGSDLYDTGIPRFENSIACAKAHEFDQNRFLNVVVDGQGKTKYGFHSNMYMMDKNLYYKCTFKNLTTAGWSANFSNVECFSFVECVFENIDGPGIDMWPICGTCPERSCTGSASKHGKGYTPAMVMLNECKFTNCGNAQRPVIDFNWTESGIIANTTITINDGRSWKWGFLGTASMMSNVTITVDLSKMVAGGAALALRQCYQARNARTNGNILRDVKSTGPVRFVNDSKAAYLFGFETDIGMSRYYPTAAAWASYSKFRETEYSYPNLFYKCSFVNENGSARLYDYALVTTDVNGTFKKEVVFQGAPQGGVGLAFQDLVPGRAKLLNIGIYDLRGRLIGKMPAGQATQMLTQNKFAKGTYVLGRQGVALTRQLAVQ